LIFPLSTFALFWSPRARTRTAVLAEWLIEVVRHLCRDKLKLREDSADLLIGTMGAEFNSPEEKILS